MLKGISTLVEYDQCIKKGLCEDHLKELNQDDLAAIKNEFPKKAFKFVRVNVLYPFLTNKPPKCEKMKKLMEKTPPIAKVLIDGKAGHIISEEAANVILIVDSVVIFTICQLSKICCIGAIFHAKKNSGESDPHIKAIQNLLLVERLNADIRYLLPVLQKNFIGYDLDIIRATHCITLLFIRKFCNKGSLKIAIETMDNDIQTNCEFDQVTVICNEYNYKNVSCVIRKTSTSSSAPFNFYKSTDYMNASDYFYSAEKYALASCFGYLAVSMEDSVGEAYYSYVKALIIQKLFKEAFDVITYGIEHCEKNSKHYKKLTKLISGLSKHIAPERIETANNVLENSVNHNNIQDNILTNRKEKSKPELVDLVDSDSGGSDSEVNKDAPGQMSADVVSDDNSSETMEKKETIADHVGLESLEQMIKEEKGHITRNIKLLKENSTSEVALKLVDVADSDEESDIKKKKQMMNGTKEKTKIKSYPRRKRTISEGSVENQPDEEMDIKKINSYLKEASEALLADCGYKAVQIFRGPLRKFIESSDFLSFEECDIVCIKYSYSIAYCKSGGHDDLEKCITILKDIIEHHDSITFPAAHYSLGLAFRKLNRFKEALNYLEIVQNFLDKGIHFKIYSWPGMTTVIQETKPDILKNLVQDLIKECENPPNPDAFCRYENCTFQPTIYYTDPDFKGYVSLCCSEQCNLQYHLQCWKTIKEEKNLTDKEFLEKSCFTPDCEGFIAKIQNIDKKGDLSKEFASEFKKPQKPPKKWDKKLDIKEKEKKKKKTIVKSEGGSQEVLTENGKDRSRKSSVCDSEATENKKDHSRESSICDRETSPLSGSYVSSEESSIKIECNQKLKQKVEVPLSSSSNSVSSFLQENSYTNNVEDLKELSLSLQESKSASELRECIKDNAYSYLADLLQYHGPLRIDDPLLTNELESFPVEISNIISKMGGIGEFLKNDMRFAIVGDLYVCFIDDLAKAYQMLSNASLPTDFKNLQTLESPEDSKYYSENGKISTTKQSSFLNPDAQEYTPTNNKSSVYKFTSNNSHQDFDSQLSLPLNLESSYKYKSSVSELDTFPASEIFVAKSKSCEAVSDSKFQNNTESVLSSTSKEKNTLITNDFKNKPELHSDQLNSRTNFFNCLTRADNTNDSTSGSVSDNDSLKYKKVEAQLLQILNQYFSEEMRHYHQSMPSLKSYIIKKMDGSVSASTMTDEKFQLGENKSLENTPANPDQDNIIEGLKKEIYDLTKQNSSLQNVLECTAEQQQKISAEVARLKKCLNESAAKIETMKKEFEKKEKDLLKEKVSLVQSLTDANKFVGNVQQKNATLAEEKLKLQKTIDTLTLTLKKEEEKMKNNLSAREKIFNSTIECLQKENAELKNRTKYAELQVLYMKKTEYLKRIEAKSLEVDEVKKEMNTPSMQLWANAAGPEQMKTLATKLNNYVDELKTIKQDFIEKIDEQIKKVKSGVSLKDLKEVDMKDLAPVPTYKNTLPENLLAGMSRFNSMTLPYFGTSTHMPPTVIVPPVSNKASSLISPTTSSLKITPPSAAVTKIIPPVTPAVNAKIIPPVAPIASIIPVVAPPATIIPPCAPSITSASFPSLASSIPPVLSASKDNKIDLVNDIDPTIQESFKSAMASINSFASTPYPVPSLDEEFDKNCVVFKHPELVSNDIKPDHPKVPPGLVNSVPHSASVRASAITPIPEPSVEASNSSGEKSYAGLDNVPNIKVAPVQNTWEPEKKKSTASYSKLLCKLKEQFPTYSQEELISYVKEVRTQRQGKLSGLTIDAIIAEISAIMKAKKKIPELKIQPKPAKVLVNKKLVPDPPKPEPQTTTKKKTAWNIDTDAAQRRFSGSADDDCTICCDPMADSAYKVACGHFFHEDCIRQWLKKNSNCPICRVLLLLPEEYPSLS